MDLSAIMNTLLSSDTVSGVSEKTGSSKGDVTSVLTSALPMLLQGAQSQAGGKKTAAGFEKALDDHSKDDTSNLLSFLNGVDLDDGAKIVGHLLGGKTSGTTKKVSKASGVSSGAASQIMSAAAPLLMSLLGKSSKDDAEAEGGSGLLGQLVGSALSNVDIGSLLSGVLGGSDSGAKKTTAKKKTSAKKTSSKKGVDLGGVANLLSGLFKK